MVRALLLTWYAPYFATTPPTSSDSDGDEIADSIDKCPTVKGVKTSDPSTNAGEYRSAASARSAAQKSSMSVCRHTAGAASDRFLRYPLILEKFKEINKITILLGAIVRSTGPPPSAAAA